MEIILKSYHEAYLAEAIRLFTDTVHSVTGEDYTKEEQNAWAPLEQDAGKWRDRFSSTYSLFAFIGERLAGFGNITDEGYFDTLYVNKDFQRQGVAATLSSRLEQHAREAGASSIEVHASITAKPFFLKRGYRLVQEQRVERLGVKLTNYIMEKSITQQSGGTDHD